MSHLRDLFAGIVTRNISDAGTDSPILLTVNQNGVDRLNHTFPDTSQSDQERGEANVYRVNVQSRGIETDTNDLNHTIFRLGIGGGDQWRPQDVVVWGERFAGGAIIPLTIETNVGVALSTEAGEGSGSMVLRRVSSGGANMMINRLLVMMTTSSSEDSGTDSGVELRISRPGGIVVDFDFPDSSQSDQERGEANLYFAPVDFPFRRSELNGNSITLRIKGGDAWRPTSFFVFGLDDAAGRPESLVPLVHLKTWNLGQMSTDAGEGRAVVRLPLAVT